jgi:hypothetical protein
MSVDWDRYKSDGASGYVRWTQVGQEVHGLVLSVRTGSGFGQEYPELVLRTEEGDLTLSVAQVALQRLLADDPPVVGDEVHIKFVGEAKASTPGHNAAKLFDVTVTHNTQRVGVDDLT